MPQKAEGKPGNNEGALKFTSHINIVNCEGLYLLSLTLEVEWRFNIGYM